MNRQLRLQVLLSAIDKVTGPLKKITQGSQQLTQALKTTQEQKRALERVQKSATGYATTQQALRGTQQRLVQAREQVLAMQAAMRRGEGDTAKFRNAFTKANLAVRDLTARSRTQRQQLNTHRQALRDAGFDTSRFAQSQQTLTQRLATTNGQLRQQRQHLERANQAAERYAKSWAALKSLHGKGMSTMAHGVGFAYAARTGGQNLANFLRPGMEFDTTFSRVQALTRLDKDDEQLKKMRAHARELGAKTLFTSTQVAEGQAFLAMAGFTPERILAAMPGILDMAKAGNMELGTTADIGSNILTAMKLDASEMGRVADIVTGAFTRSNTSIATIGETMKYAAPGAARFGIDLELVAAMAAKLGDAGIQGGTAGVGIRRVISRLTAPNKAARDAIEKLGITVADAAGRMRPMETLLEELYQRSRNLGEIEAGTLWKDIAGETGANALGILVDEAGRGNLQKLLKGLREQTIGEAAKVAGIMADNMTGDLDQMTSAWADVRIQIFDDNNHEIRSFIQSITGKIRQLGSWVKENPEATVKWLKWAAGIIAVVGALGLVLVPLGMAMIALSGIGRSILFVWKLFGVLKFVFMGIGAVLKIGLLPVIAIIAVIAGAVYLIWKNWDWLKAKFMGWWTGLKSAWEKSPLEMWKYLGQTIKKMGVALGEAILDIGVAAGSALWEGIKYVWDNPQLLVALSETLMNWSPIGLLYTYVVHPIMELFGIELPRKFSDFGKQMIDSLISGLSEAARDLPKKIRSLFPGHVGIQLGSLLFEGARDLWRGRNDEDAPQALASPARIDSRPPLMLRPAAAPPAGDSISITIHAPAGANEATLAQQVQRVMEDWERKKAARQRSSLYDNN